MLHRTMFAIAMLPLAAAAYAGEPWIEVTPFLGARGGATLDATPSGPDDAEADPALSYGVITDLRLHGRPDVRLEFSWDRQELDFEAESDSSAAEDFDLTIDYFHAGSTYEPRQQGRVRPFIGMALGVTLLNADGATVDESWALSGSIGGGAKLALGERLALRLELRGYGSFTDGELDARCGAGCSVHLESDGWYQLGGRVGLIFRVDKKGKTQGH